MFIPKSSIQFFSNFVPYKYKNRLNINFDITTILKLMPGMYQFCIPLWWTRLQLLVLRQCCGDGGVRTSRHNWKHGMTHNWEWLRYARTSHTRTRRIDRLRTTHAQEGHRASIYPPTQPPICSCQFLEQYFIYWYSAIMPCRWVESTVVCENNTPRTPLTTIYIPIYFDKLN